MTPMQRAYWDTEVERMQVEADSAKHDPELLMSKLVMWLRLVNDFNEVLKQPQGSENENQKKP